MSPKAKPTNAEIRKGNLKSDKGNRSQEKNVRGDGEQKYVREFASDFPREASPPPKDNKKKDQQRQRATTTGETPDSKKSRQEKEKINVPQLELNPVSAHLGIEASSSSSGSLVPPSLFKDLTEEKRVITKKNASEYLNYQSILQDQLTKAQKSRDGFKDKTDENSKEQKEKWDKIATGLITQVRFLQENIDQVLKKENEGDGEEEKTP